MITIQEATAAVLVMAEIIDRFPQTKVGQAQVIAFLQEFVDTREHLAWLTTTATRSMERFQMRQLRALYCTHYKPADGKPDEPCDIPGYTPADLELRAFEARKQVEQRKLQQWKQEQKRLTGSEDGDTWEPKELQILARKVSRW